MRKWTIENGQLKIIIAIFAFSFYILHSTFYIPVAMAVDSTPSADIRSKLEELKKEIASKAAQIKQDVNRKLKDKAYIGIVKSKSDTSLTLATDSGPKIVNINQDTIFESKQSLTSKDVQIKSKQKLLQANTALEDYIAALGDADETGVLTARKVVFMKTPSTQPKTYLWGQIISISDQLITLKNNESKNIAATIPSQSEVNLNDFIILTGNKNEQSSSSSKSGVFETDFIYVIPQKGVIRPKKTATPSAKLTTPSPKPIKTPKPS